MIYYPKLSKYDFGWFRLSGPGLANCLFMVARCYVESVESKGRFIDPTWTKISIGPLLRGEHDKRTYTSLFKGYGIIGVHKIALIILSVFNYKKIKVISDIRGYFQPLYGKSKIVTELFSKICKSETLKSLEESNLSDYIAIHVRLGDYSAERRVDIGWYKGIVENIITINPTQKFALFSDGTDEELKALTCISGVERHFYGNAFADMSAISKCKCVIASDSTFSAWGAFLGQKPIIFSRRHFPPVHGPQDNIPEFVLGNSTKIPNDIKELI